jgi:hypothetical protein
MALFMVHFLEEQGCQTKRSRDPAGDFEAAAVVDVAHNTASDAVSNKEMAKHPDALSSVKNHAGPREARPSRVPRTWTE